VARLGCHYLSNGDPGQQQHYDQQLREHGHDPSSFNIAQLRWCHVAPTTDEAWRGCQEHLHYMLGWYRRWADASGDDTGRQGRPLPAPGELRHSDVAKRAFIGSPGEVLEQISSFLDGVRTTHLVLGMHLPGLPPERTRRSMELVASEVLPHLR
jgi:alkanesulfonate monooxygenase SsuD/methylene tetrahydromethanopterin reductase-like flavin-dependent oxidoreductase (luciferase family)